MGFLVLLVANQNARRRPGRDRDAFGAIADALAATGEFDEVRFSPPPAEPIGADRGPLVVITPVEWHESPDSLFGSVLRRVTYSLTLVVRAQDPRDRFEILDRLSGVVQDALGNASLAGFCLGAMSRLGHGRYDPGSRAPDLRLVLDGEFGYAIASADGHNVSR